MVIAHGGHLAVLIAFSVGNGICAGVADGARQVLRELCKSGGGEGGEEIRHCVP